MFLNLNPAGDVFRTQSTICHGLFFIIVNVFYPLTLFPKVPFQMLDRFLNTPLPTTAWKVPKYGVFFWSVFSLIWTEYGDLRSKYPVFSPNTGKVRTRKNSVFGHFSHSKLCTVSNLFSRNLNGIHLAVPLRFSNSYVEQATSQKHLSFLVGFTLPVNCFSPMSHFYTS